MSNVKITVLDPIWINVDREANQMVMPTTNRLKVKRYDGTVINANDYEVITIDQNVNSGTINLPASPQNGEHYIVVVLTGPNAVTLNANGKTFTGGFTQLPIPPNSTPFTFQMFFDELYNIWRVYATN